MFQRGSNPAQEHVRGSRMWLARAVIACIERSMVSWFEPLLFRLGDVDVADMTDKRPAGFTVGPEYNDCRENINIWCASMGPGLPTLHTAPAAAEPPYHTLCEHKLAKNRMLSMCKTCWNLSNRSKFAPHTHTRLPTLRVGCLLF